MAIGNGNSTTANDANPEMALKSITEQTSFLATATTFSSSLKRNISQGKLMNSEIKETNVKVLYTGGTIGMVRNEQNGE